MAIVTLKDDQVTTIHAREIIAIITMKHLAVDHTAVVVVEMAVAEVIQAAEVAVEAVAAIQAPRITGPWMIMPDTMVLKNVVAVAVVVVHL